MNRSSQLWLIESSNHHVRRRCHNRFSFGTDCAVTANAPRQNGTNYFASDYFEWMWKSNLVKYNFQMRVHYNFKSRTKTGEFSQITKQRRRECAWYEYFKLGIFQMPP